MSAHLIGFAIGPVQEFIQAGRKTRDLWFGSHLLSEIAKAAAQELKEHADLVFPDRTSLADERPAPNKLLGMLEDDVVPEMVAGAVRDAAVGQLEAYRDDLLARHGRWLDLQLATAQVADFLEFYAAWCPVPATAPDDWPTPYAFARSRVEALIAGRKATRDFVPPSQPATSHRPPIRSALDPGQLSVVIEPHDDQQRQAMTRALKLRGAERLDAVSLIKRTAILDAGGNVPAQPGDERFVSTARIAIDPFVRRLVAEHDDRLTALSQYAGKLRGIVAEQFASTGKMAPYRHFPWDIQSFWDPGISSTDLTGYDDADKVRYRAHASAFYATAQEAMRDYEDIVELPAYYAIVRADGDRMGKLITQLTRHTWHKRFSHHAARFAGEVTKHAIVHGGALIYSGGDDVLAFLPLDTALAFAEAIHTAWHETMTDIATDPVLVDDGVVLTELPTLSAGIAIVHYSEHLQRALHWAGDAEQAAKQAGRNRIALAFYPRGAGSASAQSVREWKDVGDWKTLIDLHRANDLPDGAGYELRELADRFTGVPAQLVGSVLGPERDRILLRKRGQHGQTPIPQAAHAVLGTASPATASQLARLADEIIVTREIAKAQDTAGRPLNPAIHGDSHVEGAAS